MAIVGFILSLPIVCPLIGTVLCFIALSQIRQTGEGGRGLAIAGICISLGLVVLGLGLLLVGAAMGSSSGY
jgi:peptidyl-prolyl cis-trans isomerase B (cyclophilin B)